MQPFQAFVQNYTNYDEHFIFGYQRVQNKNTHLIKIKFRLTSLMGENYPFPCNYFTL